MHITKYQSNQKLKKIKSNDKRGSKTSELQKRAKHYKQTHPATPYRDCLMFAAKNLDDSNESSDESKNDYLSDTDTIIKQQLIKLQYFFLNSIIIIIVIIIIMEFNILNKTICLCGKCHSGKSELIKYILNLYGHQFNKKNCNISI